MFQLVRLPEALAFELQDGDLVHEFTGGDGHKHGPAGLLDSLPVQRHGCASVRTLDWKPCAVAPREPPGAWPRPPPSGPARHIALPGFAGPCSLAAPPPRCRNAPPPGSPALAQNRRWLRPHRAASAGPALPGIAARHSRDSSAVRPGRPRAPRPAGSFADDR